MPHIKGDSIVELLKSHDPTDPDFSALLVKDPAKAITGIASTSAASATSPATVASTSGSINADDDDPTVTASGPGALSSAYHKHSGLKAFGRTLAAAAIACVPVLGWLYLWNRYVLVEPGQVAMCMDMNGKVEIYGPGRHLILSPYSHLKIFSLVNNKILYKVDENDAHAQCQIITVKPGEIGIGSDKGKSTVLMPGVHFIRSKTFIFDKFQKVTDPVISFNGGLFLTVNHNECRKVTSNGKMEIFTKGCYKLMGAYTVDPDPIPLTKQEVEVEVKNQRTKDNAPITQKAHVYFTIDKPEVLFAKFRTFAEVISHIKNKAEAALGRIINNINIGDYHQVADATATSASVSAGSANASSVKAAPAPSAKKASLREDMGVALSEKLVQELDPLGITTEAVEPDETILDPALQKVLTDQAAANIKLASDKQTLEGRLGLKAAEAKAEAEVELVKEKNKAAVKEVEAGSAAKVKKIEVGSETERVTALATAQATAITTRANAQLQAGQTLSQNPVAVQLALADQMIGALAKANITLVGSDISSAAAGLLFRATGPAAAPVPALRDVNTARAS